jgi:hypothetical protein
MEVSPLKRLDLRGTKVKNLEPLKTLTLLDDVRLDI